MRLKWPRRVTASMKSDATSTANTAACKGTVGRRSRAAGAWGGRRRLLVWLFFCLYLFAPPAAQFVGAHGDHGDAAPAEGGVSLFSFDGFQAELLTFPRPPRAGEETKIVVNIVREPSFE